MAKKNTHILILAKKGSFRDRLKGFCSEMGKTRVVDDMESALNLIAGGSFQLFLLDWDLIQPDFSVLWQMLDNFQPDSRKVALFKAPQLYDVIAVMKAGMNDVFWENQDSEVLKGKLKDVLSQAKPDTVAHSYISQLAECLADRAVAQKTSLFKARKEFSKTFLSQILKQHKLKHYQLAGLMSVTPRTLHRQLLK
jgi:DNA-binding response OmpR family regulator